MTASHSGITQAFSNNYQQVTSTPAKPTTDTAQCQRL